MTGRCRNPEEMIGQFEDTLNIRFYHPEYRLMKIKSQSCEKPGIYYEAFEASLECTRENKYSECLSEIMKTLFSDENYCNLVKQVYQSVVLIIANKYTKYDLQLLSSCVRNCSHSLRQPLKTKGTCFRGLTDIRRKSING